MAQSQGNETIQRWIYVNINRTIHDNQKRIKFVINWFEKGKHLDSVCWYCMLYNACVSLVWCYWCVHFILPQQCRAFLIGLLFCTHFFFPLWCCWLSHSFGRFVARGLSLVFFFAFVSNTHSRIKICLLYSEHASLVSLLKKNPHKIPQWQIIYVCNIVCDCIYKTNRYIFICTIAVKASIIVIRVIFFFVLLPFFWKLFFSLLKKLTW